MVKPNYSKAEDAFDKEMHQIMVDQLIAQADKAQGKKIKKEISKEQAVLILENLKRDLSRLKKYETKIYEKIGLEEKTLKKFLYDPTEMSADDWKLVKSVRKKLWKFQKEIQKNLPKLSDEELIKLQKKLHIYKRHKVNEKWIPLDTH